MKQLALIFLVCLVCLAPALILHAAQKRGDELDQRVLTILEAKCVMCHDRLGASAGAGVNNLLKLDDLVSAYGDAKQPEQSGLYQLIAGKEPKMPQRRLKDVDWGGPLAESDKADILKWLKRGGPSSQYLVAEKRELITGPELLKRIARDLDTLDKPKRLQARYLTLANLHNHRRLRNAELERFRQAVVKLLNSLSRSEQVLGLDTSKTAKRIVVIDDERAILRFDLEDLGWSAADWDKIAQHDPYALELLTEDGQQIAGATSSKRPFLRADWFVFAASQPPLYHELVSIPAQLKDLETSLGLDREQAIRDGRVARAGFDHSQVSFNNRLVERIPLPSRRGGYHLSYDFASNTGTQNLRDNPLGPPGVLDKQFEKFAFKHDGGEAIFNLPNGFQAYALVTATGQRIDTAPQAIVADRTMPGGVIINGISCISCHYQGMKPERGLPKRQELDEVGVAAAMNFERFSAADRLQIAARYPSHKAFERLLEQDTDRFLAALQEAGIEPSGPDEPVRLLFDFFTNDLDLDMVAADFGLTPDACRQQLDRHEKTRQNLMRMEQGGLKRQLYQTEFQSIARLIGAGDPREFVKLPAPFFGEKVDVAQSPRPANDKPLLGQTGVALLDDENRTGKLQVELRTVNDQRSYLEGESVEFHVRANADCFLTVLTVDPQGEVVQLLPNKFHPELRLKRGQTVTLPTPAMKREFDFDARPPHGLSEIKVIATTKAIHLADATPRALAADGLIQFGNLRSGSKAIGVRVKPNIANAQEPDKPLTADNLDKLLAPNEWGTSAITVVTRERRHNP
ncbi:MAG: DUF4384 domain-containing protein [Planctomycetaceae bacterium]